MTQSWLTNVARWARAGLPHSVWRPVRALATALVTPVRFSLATGHWKSSIHQTARSADGSPIPWYTYAAIDFLAPRNFSECHVLEFGGGQSTRWWAMRSRSVLTVEEDEVWYNSLRATLAPNVTIRHVPVNIDTRSISNIRDILAAYSLKKYNVIVIDGHLRREIVDLAFEVLAPNGAIIFDNSEGYGFSDEIKDRNCRKVDFFGFAPGVSKRHCTSLVFVEDCFMLGPNIPVHDIENPSK